MKGRNAVMGGGGGKMQGRGQGHENNRRIWDQDW